MSSSVLDLYDRLRTAPNDEARARIIAEAFEALEERYPHLGDMATRTNLGETELRLVREIEQVRLETETIRSELKETELRLVKEIEQVRSETEAIRSELRETELRLLKEIEQVRLKMETIRSEMKETELRLLKEIEQVRLEMETIRSEMKETELRLVKAIEQVRAELKVDIANSHTAWLKWSFLFWLSQFGAIVLLLWRVWPQ
ncbi:hypothetical protein MIT9_P0510 [Methylomarinovum caldicuralii]|uniref:DUF1640 domain-containing protein n=1 Tax=Methylomarinovum caldicuralii TaxID=438856 RepID=A0AAU9CSP4_9GAMM|nr:hypothetical protein [Methylomarinovum caldicuralii]BCX80932.1 hypothetical protein MIT9_P0510 [Methylomarinovum caldicuralii]